MGNVIVCYKYVLDEADIRVNTFAGVAIAHKFYPVKLVSSDGDIFPVFILVAFIWLRLTHYAPPLLFQAG